MGLLCPARNLELHIRGVVEVFGAFYGQLCQSSSSGPWLLSLSRFA